MNQIIQCTDLELTITSLGARTAGGQRFSAMPSVPCKASAVPCKRSAVPCKASAVPCKASAVPCKASAVPFRAAA